MKRSLIIVVVIAVAILAGYIILGQSKSGIKRSLDESKMKATQAQLKTFASVTLLDMFQYYQDEKNTIPYNENPNIKQNLEAKLVILKQKNDGQYEYRIYDEPEGDAAIKAAELSSGIYVCIDSKDVKVVDSTKDEFEKATNCFGGPLK